MNVIKKEILSAHFQNRQLFLETKLSQITNQTQIKRNFLNKKCYLKVYLRYWAFRSLFMCTQYLYHFFPVYYSLYCPSNTLIYS